MLRIFCLLIFMVAGPVWAQQQADIYHTEVQLTASDNAESVAKTEGLVNVLIKVSGQRDIANNGVIKKALTQSDRYVTQMSFVDHKDAPRGMKLGYNPKMVTHLLTQSEQSIWEAPRKPVLVWIVNEYNYQRSIIWEQSDSNLITRIKQAAYDRGLPVLFPVGDFDDVTSIEIPDLWGSFKKPIADASERYNPQAILVVKIRGNSLSWDLFDTTPQYLVKTSKKAIEGTASGAVQLSDMINDVSDYFADTYSKKLGTTVSQSEMISIAGIHSTEGFFTLEKQLKQLNSVASVQVDSIQGDKVIYTLNLLGDWAQFNAELLSRNTRISVVPEEVITSNNNTIDANVDAGATEQNNVTDTTSVNKSTIVDASKPDAVIASDKDPVNQKTDTPVIHAYQLKK
ncbi:DUF2066 domain-containing protein [Aliivibrio logei]|uniref:DUF2066 domain-containing protein n=1 Tax=Aliivibrio logei TaxID=688 RepID=A0A1B9NXV6_ALILO|nr:DUF2066 domain-containing protein [Aliivibrio logei]OCH20552.1 hypothetical protein A6E04_15310 [Aliivibrio logei]